MFSFIFSRDNILKLYPKQFFLFEKGFIQNNIEKEIPIETR